MQTETPFIMETPWFTITKAPECRKMPHVWSVPSFSSLHTNKLRQAEIPLSGAGASGATPEGGMPCTAPACRPG